jgi:hypothetical protein
MLSEELDERDDHPDHDEQDDERLGVDPERRHQMGGAPAIYFLA